MEVIGYILALALSGLVIGALARLLLPGRDPMSLLETMLAGVGNVHIQVHFFPGCLLFSIAASVILTIVLNLIVRAF